MGYMQSSFSPPPTHPLAHSHRLFFCCGKQIMAHHFICCHGAQPPPHPPPLLCTYLHHLHTHHSPFLCTEPVCLPCDVTMMGHSFLFFSFFSVYMQSSSPLASRIYTPPFPFLLQPHSNAQHLYYRHEHTFRCFTPHLTLVIFFFPSHNNNAMQIHYLYIHCTVAAHEMREVMGVRNRCIDEGAWWWCEEKGDETDVEI